MTGREWLALALGAIGGYIVFNLAPAQTPEDGWFIFITGMLASCAMMLPGISGSFILLILNKYVYIFTAIGYFKLPILLPFAAGVVAGLVFFSRVLSWTLERYYRVTVAFIIGLLFASLTVIWPFQQRVYETVGSAPRLVETHPAFPPGLSLPVALSFGFILAGVIIVLLINYLHKRQLDYASSR